MSDWVYKSATQLSRAIREKKVTSLEVVQAFIHHIEKYDRDVHALVSSNFKNAILQARDCDEKLKQGILLGPLHGVPMTLKDAFRVRGLRSTYGALPQYLLTFPKEDCQQVKSLRDAGAIFLGRTNTPLLSLDWQCRNFIFPEGLNPWDFQRTPGGSSGGAAAALACGFTPLELGSDLGGSILYPSHCCGVLGLRTSENLLPNFDIGPEGLPQPFEHLFSTGPMARSISDLRLMLEVLLGDKSSELNYKIQKPGWDSRPLKIAALMNPAGLMPEDSTQKAFQVFCDHMQKDGHQVFLNEKPDFDFAEAYELQGIIAGYEMFRVLPWFFKTKVGNFLFSLYFFNYKMGPGPFGKFFKKGFGTTAEEYKKALQKKGEIASKTDEFFKKFDLWLLPISPGPAIRRQRWGHAIQPEISEDVKPQKLKALGLKKPEKIPYSEYIGSFIVPTVVTETPALAFPVENDSGLPIGLRLHAAKNHDLLLLQMAEKYCEKYFSKATPDLDKTLKAVF